MGFLERLENLIQGAVEGGASTVLRQKLKPVEIENHLERAMRDHSQPTQGGRLAPNNFTVWLHPDTFRETIADLQGYNGHCERLLNQFASQQGYTLLHPRIGVTFDTDGSLGQRDVRIDAGFESVPQSAQMHPQSPPAHTYTDTRVMQPSRQDAAQSGAKYWSLEVIHGREAHRIHSIPLGDVSVGRSRDCNIVLQDDGNTVSRHHAVIINRGHTLLVRDNKSTNGTKVNGNFVPYHVETVIDDGTEIAFGQCVVRVRMES